MKLICPHCESDNLDQGVDGTILCHKCKRFYRLVGTWRDTIKEPEKLI